MSTTRWRVLYITTSEAATEDLVVFSLLGPEDGIFTVSLTAPKSASATDYEGAMRAACAAFIDAAGGDVRAVGAQIQSGTTLN
jgi:hypothetical protein